MARHWTSDEIARLRALAKEGRSITSIAALMSRTYEAIRMVGHRHGVKFAHDIRRCPVCAALISAGGHAQHLASHGITSKSDERTVAAAIQAYRRILAHPRAFNR
jgi:hypothetical protein